MAFADVPAVRRAAAVDPPGIADDETLVRRAREDPDAFAALFRRHWKGVYAFAYRRCGSRDVAEEVTASTFERAWKALPTFSWRGGGVQPWLYRIAAAELAGWYRTERRHHTPRAQVVLRELADTRVIHEGTFEMDDAVRTALGRLRPRYQEALTLRYFAALGPEEAAAAMGCTRPTLAVVVHRALRALRKALAEEEEA